MAHLPGSGRRALGAGAAVAAVAGVVLGLALTLGDGRDPDEVALTAPTTTRPVTTAEAVTTTAAPPPPATRARPVGHPTATTTTAPPTTAAPPTTPPPTAPPTVPPTSPPPPTTAPPAPVVTTPFRASAPVTAGSWTLEPYRGLGTWLDTWDWSPTFTNGAAPFRITDLDTMSAWGVQTIYLQTARYDRPEDVLDPALLADIVAGAHARGMRVVGWYLPTFQDVSTDLRRLTAAGGLGLDGLAVDIESLLVTDPATRTARLLELSAALDGAFPDQVLGAVTLPPVATEVLNPAYWPGHPWRGLAEHYDVFLPMAYWGNRTPASGWRDGYRYTAENIDLIRSLTGRPTVPVHPIGGVGTDITADEIAGMVRAARERGALGGSVYDWVTTSSAQWTALAGFRGW